MSFKKGEAVQAITAIPFGNSSKIPRSTTGTVTKVEGAITKKYAVKWDLPQFNNPVITVKGSYLKGRFSF